MPPSNLKADLHTILSKAVVTRWRTRSGEDRDVVMLLKEVVKTVEVLEKRWG